jgi:hypothetical protein
MSNTPSKQPEIYQGLVRSGTIAKQIIVIDKHGGVFRFSNVSKISILKDAIAQQWNGWSEDFDKQPKDEILKAHQRVFQAAPPKDQQLIESSLMTWLKLAQIAYDRTDEAATAKKIAKSKVLSRTYTYIKDPAKAATLVTPQAKACLQIISESVNKETLTINEVDLKAAIEAKCALLKTRQEPWRIFQYYRTGLINSGCLKMSA